MSKRLDVVTAVKALVQRALPGCDVKGLDRGSAWTNAIPPNGLAIVRAGDPGAPDIDLNPPAYNYQHQITVELAAYQSPPKTQDQILDAMLVAIGQAIAADRCLGGLCEWLEALAPGTDDLTAPRATPAIGTELTIVAHYAAADPLL